MGVAQVVIVGRPNVGKSSLFNWLVGKRIAIVDPTAGVTRDRVSYLTPDPLESRFVELVDTGGMGIVDADNLSEEIESQIQTAIDSADLVLLVVDTRAGLTPLDQEVAKRLRYLEVPVICVANKANAPSLDSQADEFYKLGRKLVRVSTQQNRGKAELECLIAERLPPAPSGEEPPEDAVMKVAIVGRRNVGKSTLVNTLAHADRMITSEVPGTTRDSVDVRFEMDGKVFMAIDTPGFRRSKSVSTNVDFYSTHRAQRSIRRADVVLLFFDATQRISKVDRQLCDYIAQQYKPCIFVVNKWDLVADSMPTDKWVTYLRDVFRTMIYAPIAFITGQSGKNVKAMLNHAQMLFKQAPHPHRHGAVEQAGAGGHRKELAADLSEPPAASTMPPKWPSSRPRSCSFAATPGRSRSSTSVTCSVPCASSWAMPKCPSSSISAAASRATAAMRSTPRSKGRRRKRKTPPAPAGGVSLRIGPPAGCGIAGHRRVLPRSAG